MAFPAVPPSFRTLQAAYEIPPGQPYNTIGVCTDYKDAMQSKGPDMTMGFTLHDPSWFEGLGMPVRFFNRIAACLPKISSTGDVVILRNVKNTVYAGERCSFSNSASSWMILEYDSIENSTLDDGSDVIVHCFGKDSPPALRPSILEMQYAKAILSTEDPARWRKPLTRPKTMDEVPSAQSEQVPSTLSYHRTFTLIENASLVEGRNYVFRDLFGEVRRIWDRGDGERCEISVTDYTENKHLFDYRHGDPEEGTGYDYGDHFGYVASTHKKWPGPWGKMTMTIVCWRPHCGYILQNVKEGDYITLSNVQVKFDKNGTRLEGNCRTDSMYPEKVNVQRFRLSEAESNDRYKDLLRRKRDYEEYCRKHHLPFIRDAKTIRPLDKLQNEDKENEAPNPKSKRNKSKKERSKAKKAKTEIAAAAKAGDMTAAEQGSTLTSLVTNANIRCKNIDIPLSTVSYITDPSTLRRKTPAGNDFSLPFQNSCYRSKIRVVDFFPDCLEDFCAPVRNSSYGALSDNESQSDVASTQDSRDLDDDDAVRWEWRFILLVEDAKPSLKIQPAQLELQVCAGDGAFLLREDACNLKKNPKALANLRESMFHLWGDLQEQKSELTRPEEHAALKPNGRPFECFIKEYGVPAQAEQGKNEEDVEKWERMFRLCWTTISKE